MKCIQPKNSQSFRLLQAARHASASVSTSVRHLSLLVAAMRPPQGKMATVGMKTVSLLALGVAACSGDRNAIAPSAGASHAELVRALTPELAALVGSDGRLDAAAPSNTGRPQISKYQAGLLAIGVAKYNLPYLHRVWDAQHGRTISYQELSVCEDPLYAASPFERLELDEASRAAHPLQKALGPFWLVKLCGPAGDPQVKIAVSAYATDLGIHANGSIDFPPIGGGDFVPAGIPRARLADELQNAEDAAVFAASLTGRRVAAIPQLVVPFFKDDNPLGARWRVRLEAPAPVKTVNGNTVDVSELYVSGVRGGNGSGARTWSPNVVQPKDVAVAYMPMTFVGENIKDYSKRQQAETRDVRAVRSLDMPVVFSATVKP